MQLIKEKDARKREARGMAEGGYWHGRGRLVARQREARGTAEGGNWHGRGRLVQCVCGVSCAVVA